MRSCYLFSPPSSSRLPIHIIYSDINVIACRAWLMFLLQIHQLFRCPWSYKLELGSNNNNHPAFFEYPDKVGKYFHPHDGLIDLWIFNGKYNEDQIHVWNFRTFNFNVYSAREHALNIYNFTLVNTHFAVISQFVSV